MDQNLKDKIAEIVELVNMVPTNLQEKCFEVLLSHHLAKLGTRENVEQRAAAAKGAEDSASAPATELKAGEDLQLKDLQVKARKFLEKHGLSIDHLNQLFYKEGNDLKPLYEDLKTTKTAESQTRIALLLALQSAITTGEFVFNGETVRDECRIRKCYDPGNFTQNFKNNAALFDGFDKYVKSSPNIRLSDGGREELSKLINELQ